jgi:hypothetical protein
MLVGSKKKEGKGLENKKQSTAPMSLARLGLHAECSPDATQYVRRSMYGVRYYYVRSQASHQFV